jgi:hypothetical protein
MTDCTVLVPVGYLRTSTYRYVPVRTVQLWIEDALVHASTGRSRYSVRTVYGVRSTYAVVATVLEEAFAL